VLSHTVEYALRAITYVSRQAPRAAPISEIAKAIGAPRPYLAKILGQLARSGLLASTRGRAGGFTLTARTRDASLAQVAEVFEPHTPQRCLLGHGTCGDSPDCELHSQWAPIARASTEFFGRTTIADLLSTRTLS
jgi:Rrf2 family protein